MRAPVDVLRTVFEALPTAVVFVELGQDGKALLSGHNSALERILGVEVPSGATVGDLPIQIFQPDRTTLVPHEELPATVAARTGRPVPEKLFHVRLPRGDWRVLGVSATPAPASKKGGGAIGVALMRDRTDAHRAQEDLASRGQLFRLIVEGTSASVIVKDRAKQILFANTEALRLFGRTGAEVVGKRVRDLLLDPVITEALERNDREVLDSGLPMETEETVPGPDGEHVYHCRKFPLRDSQGTVIGVVVVGRDITAQKMAERKTAASEARFRALIEASGELLVLIDAEGRVRFWSPAATDCLGWEEQEVLGRPAYELLHVQDHASTAEAIRIAGAVKGCPVRHRVRMLHRCGEYRLLEGTLRDRRDDPAIQGFVMGAREVPGAGSDLPRAEGARAVASPFPSVG